jgi:hypothetical protein
VPAGCDRVPDDVGWGAGGGKLTLAGVRSPGTAVGTAATVWAIGIGVGLGFAGRGPGVGRAVGAATTVWSTGTRVGLDLDGRGAVVGTRVARGDAPTTAVAVESSAGALVAMLGAVVTSAVTALLLVVGVATPTVAS